MKRRPHRFTHLIAACLLASVSARADIIILKSGEKVDGKILSENDTSITVQYQLTPKIKDTKVINKADIKELTRFTVAQTEIEERGLRKLVPTRDLMTAPEYEAIIQDQLRTFVAKHGGSPEAKEVEQIIATLSDEKSKVLSGQVKIEGKWVDEATAKRDVYNIDAYRVRIAMKAKAEDTAAGHFTEALREFDRLRLQYPASVQLIPAVGEALEILDKYEKSLSGMSAEYPVLKQQRDAAIKNIGPNDQATKIAIEQEDRNFKAVRDAEVKAKVKWRTLYKYDLTSIQEAMAVVAKERQELKTLDLAALRSENETLSAAIGYLAAGNATEAEAAIAGLKANRATLINKTEFAKREKELTALQIKIKAQMKAAKSAVTTGDATQPAAEGDNPLAEAMKAKTEAKKGKNAEEKEKKAKADAAKAAESVAPAPVEEPTLMEKINPYIPYIGGAVLIVLILAMVMGKKKGDEE